LNEGNDQPETINEAPGDGRTNRRACDGTTQPVGERLAARGAGRKPARRRGEASICLDFSCFVLCIKAKNEVGFGAKPRQMSIKKIDLGTHIYDDP
jgi:hypothetical protein